MAADFPNNPSVGEKYTIDDITREWTGSVWEIIATTITGPTGATGATGSTGVVSATAPVTYDSGTKTIGVDSTVVITTGTQTLSNKTLTAPKFADLGFIADANGNELIIMDTVASAVNEITIANAAAGNAPTITASGETNVSLNLVPKGSGTVQVSGIPIVTTTASQTLTNKTLTSPTVDTPLLTLSTTSSTTEGRMAWDSTNDKILVGGTLNSTAQAIEFSSSTLSISTPTFTTNAYTAALTDKDKWLELSNGATAGTFNIPTNASVAFPIGTQINIIQTGAGQITIAAVTPATTTVNGTPGLKLREQWSSATIIKRATDTWVVVGDLSA